MYTPVPKTTLPVAELLHDPHALPELWPMGKAPQNFVYEASRHATTSEAVVRLVQQLNPEGNPRSSEYPDTDQALGYTALCSLLGDPDSSRILLYLPFNLLPGRSSSETSTPLANARNAFVDSYRSTWLTLLSEHDVRANFVDGDVLETAYRSDDLPRVVKAAHFVPALLRRGFISQNEVSGILQTADAVLHQSLTEGLKAFRGDPKQVLMDSPEHHISERREAWLKKRRQQKWIVDYATNAQPYLRASEPAISELLVASASDTLHAQATIEAVYQYIVAAENAQETATKYESFFSELAANSDIAIQNAVTSVYRRLYHLGVYPRNLLNDRRITIPTLEGPFSQNLPEMSEDLLQLHKKAEQIAADPLLSQYFYPIFTVGGSRLKGYGQAGSDVDVCMFVRPEVSDSDQERIQTLASEIGGTYEPITFWLNQENGMLSVRDFANPDTHIADSYWTHVLFGTAWIGEPSAIRSFQQRLLPTYFTEANPQDRKWHLERIEQDLLQYRLMHRGYRLHYPSFKPEDSLTSPWIDGDSTFWDPGYRQLATKLFARYVSIPHSPK